MKLYQAYCKSEQKILAYFYVKSKSSANKSMAMFVGVEEEELDDWLYKHGYELREYKPNKMKY